MYFETSVLIYYDVWVNCDKTLLPQSPFPRKNKKKQKQNKAILMSPSNSVGCKKQQLHTIFHLSQIYHIIEWFALDNVESFPFNDLYMFLPITLKAADNMLWYNSTLILFSAS